MDKRSIQAKEEEKKTKLYSDVGFGLELGLEHWVEGLGGEWTGLNIRVGPDDVLVVLKASFDGKRRVAFFNGVNACTALAKAIKACKGDAAPWKDDKWG